MQLFGFVPVLRCIPRCASGMPLRPGLGTAFLQGIRCTAAYLFFYTYFAMFFLQDPMFPKPYCSGYPFVAGSIIIYFRSQKIKAERRTGLTEKQ